MKITHKITYAPDNIYNDTNSIASNCNTIVFDNYGEVDCEVYVNDTLHGHLGYRFYLKAGVSLRLGGLRDCICQDIFDIAFSGAGLGKGVNVIRETYQLLT